MKTEERKRRRQELWRMAKFTLFSISAGIVEILSFTLLNELLRIHYWVSYLVALILSVLWNFTFNRRFTFQSANNVPIAMLKIFGYYCVFTPVTTIAGNYLVDSLLWNAYLVTGMNMVCNLVTEYLFDKHVVYRNAIDTNKRAGKSEEHARDDGSPEFALNEMTSDVGFNVEE